ncbi:MAG: ATP-binding cassette domain-containing protein, partial [Cellvibrionaceae bacterium]|nr:ATP-binding cassette domain-containing protein [Cellvibrionaceae bacterium]
NSMERIVELSSLGLSSYGGNYKFYAAAKAQAQQAAAAELARCKLERKREQRAAVEQRERQQRRNAQGNRKRKGANQATILLDAQQQRSQQSTAKLQQQQLQAKQALQRRERLAAEQLDQAQTIAIGGLATAGRVRKTVARLAQLRLPFGNADMSAIDLTISGNQRIAVSGPNGCGKSTLLKVLAGQLLPKAGSCEVQGTRAYLDQRLLGLKPELSVLAQLKAANPNCAEGELRTRLAQLGLGADKTGQPSGLLSGGERLKGYLACLLYAEKPPELLLLDEPSNHLDLASIQALEQMLQSYQGALVLVSHDRVFLESVGFSHYLEFEQQSWSLECV